jgi:hypothetical protein
VDEMFVAGNLRSYFQVGQFYIPIKGGFLSRLMDCGITQNKQEIS